MNSDYMFAGKDAEGNTLRPGNVIAEGLAQARALAGFVGTPAGRKDDADKPAFHLVPWDAIEEVAKVYAFGAKKYAPRNWEEGIAYSRISRALIGHLVAWFQKGEEFDEEGNSHLNAIVFNALALRAYTLRGMGHLDDRPLTAGPLSTPHDFGNSVKTARMTEDLFQDLKQNGWL